ncbi:PDZ domain-containing protein [bacterium]|nr:PDZ domain-containing protein [bacterium]
MRISPLRDMRPRRLAWACSGEDLALHRWPHRKNPPRASRVCWDSDRAPIRGRAAPRVSRTLGGFSRPGPTTPSPRCSGLAIRPPAAHRSRRGDSRTRAVIHGPSPMRLCRHRRPPRSLSPTPRSPTSRRWTRGAATTWKSSTRYSDRRPLLANRGGSHPVPFTRMGCGPARHTQKRYDVCFRSDEGCSAQALSDWSFETMIRSRLALVLLCAGILSVGGNLPGQSAQTSLDARTYIEVAHRVLPGVVNISIEARDVPKTAGPPVDNFDDMIRFYQDQRGLGRSLGLSSGSGVLTRTESGKGYVVTNNHVVDSHSDETQIRLTFHTLTPGTTDYSNTTEIVGDQVRILGKDKLSDLAVIEFDMPEDFKPTVVEWGDSDAAEIGENVVALGNPLELNHTVTTGIISGKSRYLGQQISLEKLLQTNAVIQPGNSGGPLVNLDGKILGINNAIASRNGLWQGTSFAIPSNDAKRITDALIERGRVSRGYLGVTMKDVYMVPPEELAKYEIQRDQGGVYIWTVVRNSPADIAGVHTKDIVVAIDGEVVRSSDEMLQSIARKAVDSSVTVKLLRLNEEEKPMTLTVTARLGERPAEEIITEMHRDEQNSNEMIPKIQIDPSAPVSRKDLGLALDDWYDDKTKEAGLEVKSVAPGSPADGAGLEVGDVITSVAGRPVRSLGDFRAALSALGTTVDVQVMVKRQGVQLPVIVKQ